MRYSSVAHLSSQFKKVTGLTPSHFKRLREKKTLHAGRCVNVVTYLQSCVTIVSARVLTFMEWIRQQKARKPKEKKNRITPN